MGLDLCFSKDDWDPEGFTENSYFSKQSSGDGGREGYPERLSQQFIKGFPVQTFSFFSRSAQVIPYQQADTACLQGHRLSGFVESRGSAGPYGRFQILHLLPALKDKWIHSPSLWKCKEFRCEDGAGGHCLNSPNSIKQKPSPLRASNLMETVPWHQLTCFPSWCVTVSEELLFREHCVFILTVCPWLKGNSPENTPRKIVNKNHQSGRWFLFALRSCVASDGPAQGNNYSLQHQQFSSL